MSYTQEELNSIWQQLTDHPERNEFGELDVSEMVGKLLPIDAEGENFDTRQDKKRRRASRSRFTRFPPDDAATGDYARLRDNKERQWGVWKNGTPRPS